jgi:hypothetical protein
MENGKNCLKIMVMIFAILSIGCAHDINDETDARLNGKWVAYIELTVSIPINSLPPDYINQFPDLNVDEETGMVEMEIEYKSELELNNGKFEFINSSKGTYITHNEKITIKTTHVCFGYPSLDSDSITIDYRWYTKNELKTLPKYSSLSGEEEYFSDEEINNMFVENTYNYSVNGNTFIIHNFINEITTFTRDR